MIFAQPIKPDALWKAAGHNSGLSKPSNWHPPVSREQPGGRACPSWRVWGARFPLLPGDFGACGGALRAGLGPGGAGAAGWPGSRPRRGPGSLRPLQFPSCPRPRAA